MLTLAADQGLVDSQKYLGIFCVDGDIIERSLDRALHWHSKAASQRDAESLIQMAKLIMKFIKERFAGHINIQYLVLVPYRLHWGGLANRSK